LGRPPGSAGRCRRPRRRSSPRGISRTARPASSTIVVVLLQAPVASGRAGKGEVVVRARRARRGRGSRGVEPCRAGRAGLVPRLAVGAFWAGRARRGPAQALGGVARVAVLAEGRRAPRKGAGFAGPALFGALVAGRARRAERARHIILARILAWGG
jgi:hypothetical protein